MPAAPANTETAPPPSSTPATAKTPPSSAATTAAAAAAEAAKVTPVSWGTFIVTLLTVFLVPIVFGFIFAYGAAKLSFDRYGSFGWALLDFVFPMFYYPYYAIFVSKPASASPTLLGAMRGGVQAAIKAGKR